MTSILLRGKIPNFAFGSAIFDTGSRRILGPPIKVAALFAEIPDSSPIFDPTNDNQFTGFYRITCNTMPDVTFQLSGDPMTWTVSGKSLEEPLNDGLNGCRVDLKATPVLENREHRFSPRYANSLPYINAVGWVIGTPFLKTVRSCERTFPRYIYP